METVTLVPSSQLSNHYLTLQSNSDRLAKDLKEWAGEDRIYDGGIVKVGMDQFRPEISVFFWK